MPLPICFVSSEITPFAKTGGLADVSGALVKYLQGAGHDVLTFMPLYSRIDRGSFALEAVAALTDLPLVFGAHAYRYSVYRARLPGSNADVHFIDCPALYDRPTLYTVEPDEHVRFLALTRAAIECCQRLGFAPRIFHCNDWHTAFAPLLLRAAYGWDLLFAETRSVLTIHNIGYQSVFPAALVADLGLPGHTNLLHQDDLRAGKINPLRHGVLYAHAITTVSPTYAREICTDAYGMGLQADLRARGDALVGILNGVDYDDWDPRSDRYLPLKYDARTIHIKAELKKRLLARASLAPGTRSPLIGVISRLASQKGFDLLFDTLPALLARHDCRFIALGNGEEKYERFFADLQLRYPQRVMFHRGYSDELAHWIEAGCDMFLMPSRYEPCGLNQMYSLRYGTVPIVRRTGGLADSVQHFDPATGLGTGVVFNDFDANAMSWAFDTAFAWYASPDTWAKIVRNGMAQDFSWARQGREYVALYERLIA